MEVKENEEYDEALSKYYEGRGVSSMIMLNVDTTEADAVAKKLAGYDNLEDVFLVTGDVDMMVKARFTDYDQMKSFLLDKVSNLDGVNDIESMMIITTYKERNKKIELKEKEEKEEQN